MEGRRCLHLVTLLAVVIGQVLTQQKNLFCYYTNWSQYHTGMKFFPENINPSHCTHLVYAFAKVSADQLSPYEWNDIVTYNPTSGLYYRFNRLKAQNPQLKTLLAVGGWTHGGAPFSSMASTSSRREHFVTTAIAYLRQHGFDGLDIDWEYPGDPQRGGKAEDKANFAALVKELRLAFDAEAQRTGKPRLLLTAAVAADPKKVALGYDVPTLGRYLDFVNVMTYDLHGSWEKKTGHNAALYTSSSDPSNFSVSVLALGWASQMDRSKINVGLPAYGHTWTLADPNNNGVGATATGPGTRGQYSGEAGTLTYYEVCMRLKEGYTKRFDDQTKTPYAFLGDQWITYDNINSLQYKLTWIRHNAFGGAMLWAIDEDDFLGTICGLGPFPLTSVASQCMKHNTNCPPTGGQPTVTTTTTTPSPPGTTTPYQSRDCPSYPGIARDRYSCTKFWVCIPPNRQYMFTCPPNTAFDTNYNVCAHHATVNCN